MEVVGTVQLWTCSDLASLRVQRCSGKQILLPENVDSNRETWPLFFWRQHEKNGSCQSHSMPPRSRS